MGAFVHFLHLKPAFFELYSMSNSALVYFFLKLSEIHPIYVFMVHPYHS